MTREELQRAVMEGQVREGLANEAAARSQESSKEISAPAERYSAPQAAAMGLAQGATWNTADEIGAGLGSAYDVARSHLPGGDDTLSSMGMGGFGEAYRARREVLRDKYDQAQKEHPYAYGGAELTGAVGSSFVPGVSALNAGKVARGATQGAEVLNMAKNVAKSATTGAGFAAGASKHDIGTKGFVDDTVEGAKFGAATGGLIEGAPVMKRGGGKIGRALGNVGFGVSGEVAEHYMGNQAAVKANPGFEQTIRNFLEHADQTKGDMSKASGRSFNTLRDTGILSDHIGLTQPLTEAATSLQRGGAYGPEQRSAISYLNNLSTDVQADAAANGGMLPLDRGKNLVRVLDSKIQAMESKPGADARVLQALRDARSSADNFLKASSPEYAREMERLAADTQAFKGMTDGFRTPDGAMKKMKSIMRGRSPFDAERLANYDQHFGQSFGKDLKDAYTKEAFSRDTTNGSRKTMFGLAVGSAASSMTGNPIWAPIAAGAGFAADKMGGAVYQKILDGSISLGKFTAPLMNAAKRGQSSFAATHSLLMKNNAEYRDLIESQTQGARQ